MPNRNPQLQNVDALMYIFYPKNQRHTDKHHRSIFEILMFEIHLKLGLITCKNSNFGNAKRVQYAMIFTIF